MKDIRKIPLDHLLQYNLVDALSTWFVYEKHWDTMVADNQQDLYEGLLRCSIPDDHIDPRRSAFFMARSVLRDIRSGVRTC